MPHIEVSQLWGDSLLRVERYSRWRRLTVGPAARSDFAAALEVPTVLVDRGVLHSDEGAVEITANTDVLVDVGEQTFRVRAVAEERRVGGAFFAHVDWFFVGVVLVGLVTLILGTIATLLAIVLFLLFRHLLALVLALFGLTAPLFLQVPPSPMPPPTVFASAQIAPPRPAAPAPPLFVRPTPRPVATMVPLPIGDIPMPKRVAAKKPDVAVLKMLGERKDSGVFAVLSARELDGEAFGGLIGSSGPDGGLGGLRGSGSGVGIGGLGARGGSGAGLGGLGTRGKGAAVADVASEEYEDDDEYGEGGFADGVPGGVVGGVAGGVAGGMVGGVVGGSASQSALATGTLSKEQILATINAHLGTIRRCYEKALIADPALQGKVVVTFRIDPTGRVQNARAVSSTVPAIDACVVAEVAAMHFPPPTGGAVSVTFPFSFRSADAP